ncbi:MAG: hypothetical protein GY851_32805, partial [bacterium]|nr:hypothetical protein [bacterium]
MLDTASKQQAAVAEIARSCRQDVEQVRQGFIYGGIDLDQNSFFTRGFTAGFGTESVPPAAFSRATSVMGYTADVAGMGEGVSGSRFVPGIALEKFPPPHVAEHLYHLAKYTSGYWVYTLDALAHPDSHFLAGPVDGYWDALGVASRELVRLSENSQYASRLRIRPFTVNVPFPEISLASLPDTMPPGMG